MCCHCHHRANGPDLEWMKVPNVFCWLSIFSGSGSYVTYTDCIDWLYLDSESHRQPLKLLEKENPMELGIFYLPLVLRWHLHLPAECTWHLRQTGSCLWNHIFTKGDKNSYTRWGRIDSNQCVLANVQSMIQTRTIFLCYFSKTNVTVAAVLPLQKEILWVQVSILLKLTMTLQIISSAEHGVHNRTSSILDCFSLKYSQAYNSLPDVKW